jgi:Zn finger protein HypA/HybF involved in hydrogenase expression
LGITLKLLQWKAANGITDKGFEELPRIVKNMLLEGNELPSKTYEAKKVVCPVGLDVHKIHACPNDCILYRGDEYEKLDVCPVCGAKRYKIRQNDTSDVDREPTKKKNTR